MADWLKIAIKTGLVVSIMAILVALFTLVPIPSIDLSIFDGLGLFFAVISHWLPVFNIIWPLLLALIGFEIALMTADLALVGLRWIMKINE